MKLLVKRNLAAITAFLMVVGTFITGDIKVSAAGGDTTVYVTKTGEKYHSDGCSSLSHSKIATTLQDAVDKGYEACKKCKPPKLDSTSQAAAPQANVVAAPAKTTATTTTSTAASNGDIVVYTTKTGTKYHADGCRSLKQSKIETTLQSAVDKGYEACKVCKPPKLAAASTAQAPQANAANSAVEALKTYKGNTDEFNAYAYYTNNVDLQTAIGADGDKLLKHYNEYGKAEGRVAK